MVASARLLGPPGFEHQHGWIEPAPGKTSALLYYLAHRDGSVSRDEVLLLLWPERDEGKARSTFRQMLTAVRRLPHADGLEIERTRLRWPLATDLKAFRAALEEGRSDEAVRLYRGELLEGFRATGIPEFESWLQLERDILRDLWREAVLAAAEQLVAAAHHLEAAKLLERLCRAEPFDEEATRAQLRNLALAGRGERALEVYRDFERTLRHELGSEPAPATRQLIERVRRGELLPAADQAGATTILLPPAPSRLPAAATPFVGRERELHEVAELLADPARRLVTLIGPGGIGKTRLALKTAARLAGEYRDGVAFVPLAAIEDTDQVPAAIATALGLQMSSDEVPAQLRRYLERRTLLLVLDNLEQLRDVTLIAELLAIAPDLQVLATSRRRLDLQAEWLYELAGLNSPAVDEAADVAGGHDAVKLFAQSARRLRAGLAFDPEEAAAAARISRAVAGMPLALELAASWLRAFPPAELAAEVERSLDLLHTSAGDMPPRHRSVRTAFDGSWALLTPEEQQVLARLGVFHDGFDRASAVAVSGTSLTILTGLVDRSLVQLGARGRFDLHPLMGQYLLEKLEQAGALEEARAWHGRHYLALLGVFHGQLWGQMREALAGWRLERENIRAAWLWAAGAGQAGLVKAALLPLVTLFGIDARSGECLELLEAASERLGDADDSVRGALLVCRADLMSGLHRYPEAERLATQGLGLLAGSDDAYFQAIGHLVPNSADTENHEAPNAHLDQALALAGSLDEPLRSTLTAFCLHQIEFAADHRGDRDASARLLDQMIELYEGVNYGPGMTSTRLDLSFQALHRGRYQEAERLALQAAQAARESGLAIVEAFTLMVRSRAAYGLGRSGDAKELALACLQALERTDARSERAVMLATLGRACAQLGEYREAERHLRSCLELAWELSKTVTIFIEAIVYLAELRAEQGQLAEAASYAGLAAHFPLTRAWNLAQAEALLTDLKTRMSAEAFDEAVAAGERLELETLIEELLQRLGEPEAA